MANKLKAVLDLGRVANLPTVWSNLLAGFGLVHGFPEPWMIVAIVAGGSLVYMGGCTLNDVCDLHFDRQYRPERAIPSGVLSRRLCLRLAIDELAAGALLIMLPQVACRAWAGIGVTLGLVAAVVVYDLVHKRWGGAVWIMGLCRALLWMIPATLAGRATAPVVCLWAGLLCLYIGGVSLTARGESRPGGKALGGLGLILLFLPLAGWIGLLTMGETNAGAGWLSVPFAILFLAVAGHAVRLMRRHPPATIGPAVGWLLAAIPLVDAMALSLVWPLAAVVAALGLPLTRSLQQYLAST